VEVFLIRVHILARAVIFNRRGEVLLAQADGQSHTFLPGGHAEPPESLSEALARELREELGVACRVGAYLGAVEWQWPESAPTDYEVNHLFRVEADVAERPVALESHLRFFWQPAGRLAEAVLHPAPLRDLIPRYLAGDRSVWWSSYPGPGRPGQ
jgi:8-oxo-dGTP diphosphatase